MMSAKGLNKTYTLWFLCWEVIERKSDLQPFPDLNIEMFFMSLHQRGRSEDGLAETGFHFPGEKRERRSWLCSRDTQKKIKKKICRGKKGAEGEKDTISDTFPSQTESLLPRTDPNLLLSGGGNQGYGHKGFTSKGVQTPGDLAERIKRLTWCTSPQGKETKIPQDKRSWKLLREMKHVFSMFNLGASLCLWNALGLTLSGEFRYNIISFKITRLLLNQKRELAYFVIISPPICILSPSYAY